MAQATGLEGLTADLIAMALGGVGIAQNLFQCTNRQIGLLRQEQDPGVLGQAYASSAKGPEAGERAKERGLAAAGGTFEGDLLALPNDQVDAVEQQCAIGQANLHLVHLQLPSLRCARDELALCCRALGRHYGLAEARETVDHRLPLCKLRIG